MVKYVTVMGSTGSVGRTTLGVIRNNPDELKVHTLIAGSDAELLIQQAIEFRPKMVVISDITKYKRCSEELSKYGIAVIAGLDEGINAMESVDCAVSAMTGIKGLRPTIAAARLAKVVAIANKESIICGAHLLNSEDKGKFFPLDSEHVALKQILDGRATEDLHKLVITASGGPAWNMTREEMMDLEPSRAIAHPNWSMGAKISVDSATSFNKVLEVLEAYFFFPGVDIDVLVHRQSIVHAMAYYLDGSVIAQLSNPDMGIGVSYALLYPRRRKTSASFLDLLAVKKLTFEALDYDKFPLLSLIKRGDLDAKTRVIMNAADEIAVNRFLNGEIGFLDIERIIFNALDAEIQGSTDCVEEIFALHQKVSIMYKDIVF